MKRNLLLRIAEGDEAAFSTLFYQAVPRLRPALNHFTRMDIDTEEVIQETFIRVWLNRETLPDIENIYGYLYRIAVNAFMMRLRKEVAGRIRDKKWNNAYREETDWSGVQATRLKEMKQVVEQAVRNLPSQRRKVYTLSRDEGMSIAEIANHLGISESTVKNTLGIALSSIRRQLLEVGYTLDVISILLLINFF